MNKEHFYSTREVSVMFSKNVAAILKYARTIETIHKEGRGKATRYYWTEKDIENYKVYLEEIKNHTNYRIHHGFKETDKIDTLYKRLNRAIKKGENELAANIRKDIEDFRKRQSSL